MTPATALPRYRLTAAERALLAAARRGPTTAGALLSRLGPGWGRNRVLETAGRLASLGLLDRGQVRDEGKPTGRRGEGGRPPLAVLADPWEPDDDDHPEMQPPGVHHSGGYFVPAWHVRWSGLRVRKELAGVRPGRSPDKADPSVVILRDEIDPGMAGGGAA